LPLIFHFTPFFAIAFIFDYFHYCRAISALRRIDANCRMHYSTLITPR